MEILEGENITVADVQMCPHRPDAGCDCRKPGVAMLERAAKNVGLVLEESFMVGDKACDIEAGRNVGARSILVETGYGKKERERNIAADFFAGNLDAAARWIIKIRNDV